MRTDCGSNLLRSEHPLVSAGRPTPRPPGRVYCGRWGRPGVKTNAPWNPQMSAASAHNGHLRFIDRDLRIVAELVMLDPTRDAISTNEIRY